MAVLVSLKHGLDILIYQQLLNMAETQFLKPSHDMGPVTNHIILDLQQVREVVEDRLYRRDNRMVFKYHHSPFLHHMDQLALCSQENLTSSHNILKPIQTSNGLMPIP
jgi:hypothetical protein